jgi:hypothetical protein
MSAKTRGVSFPDDLLEAAQAKAASQGRSFSNYIQTLLREDTGMKGNHANKRSRARNKDSRSQLPG